MSLAYWNKCSRSRGPGYKDAYRAKLAGIVLRAAGTNAAAPAMAGPLFKPF
jgi:hypothetical protein